MDPGWLHDALAEATVVALKSRLPKLDVGATPDDPVDAIIGEPGADDDGREPVEILSRVYAHIGYRLPFVKRIEKRLEGQDKSSGIASDILALGAQIVRRNKPIFKALLADLVQQQREARLRKETAKAAAEYNAANPPQQEVPSP